MSNPNAEIITNGRVNDQIAAPMQNTAASPFDALQLHKEGAALNAQTTVAENNIVPAVYRPGEVGANPGQAGAHLEDVQFRGRGPGYDRNYGGALAGTLLYDTLVAPYAGYPAYPPNYNYGPQVQCYPSQFYGAPPVCYAAPIVPFYGRGGYYAPEPRFYEQPRGGYERGGGGGGRGGHR